MVTHSLLPVALQAPLSMGFPRQEYWSGLPFPSPGDPPDPGLKLKSSAFQADSLPTESHKAKLLIVPSKDCILASHWAFAVLFPLSDLLVPSMSDSSILQGRGPENLVTNLDILKSRGCGDCAPL